jgi:hypothetical protein
VRSSLHGLSTGILLNKPALHIRHKNITNSPK